MHLGIYIEIRFALTFTQLRCTGFSNTKRWIRVYLSILSIGKVAIHDCDTLLAKALVYEILRVLSTTYLATFASWKRSECNVITSSRSHWEL